MKLKMMVMTGIAGALIVTAKPTLALERIRMTADEAEAVGRMYLEYGAIKRDPAKIAKVKVDPKGLTGNAVANLLLDPTVVFPERELVTFVEALDLPSCIEFAGAALERSEIGPDSRRRLAPLMLAQLKEVPSEKIGRILCNPATPREVIEAAMKHPLVDEDFRQRLASQLKRQPPADKAGKVKLAKQTHELLIREPRKLAGIKLALPTREELARARENGDGDVLSLYPGEVAGIGEAMEVRDSGSVVFPESALVTFFESFDWARCPELAEMALMREELGPAARRRLAPRVASLCGTARRSRLVEFYTHAKTPREVIEQALRNPKLDDGLKTTLKRHLETMPRQ